jgi:hypothetical protein
MRPWRVLVKYLLAWLRVRRYAPEPWGRSPGPLDLTDAGTNDTGGAWYRPTHRRQDPASDPAEPGGGESSGAGNDHGWANCTMAAGAMALDFHTLGRLKEWGGDLRHHQGDQDGGTDLYDLRDAWAAYGETLSIRSGAGWSGLTADREAGRFLVVQGSGNVPGSATFDGGHACALGPENAADGDWLFGDPLASGWQWVSPSSIRTWMEAWAGSGLAYARSAAHDPGTSPPPAPEPPPAPAPDRYPAGYQDGTQAGLRQGRAEALDGVFRSWSPGGPRTPLAPWDGTDWGGGAWGVIPYPVAALARARTPAAWGQAGWTAATWRGEEAPDDTWGQGAWSSPWT